MQGGQHPGGGDLEKGPGVIRVSPGCGAIKIAVRPQGQPTVEHVAIGSGEVVQYGERPRGRDLINCAYARSSCLQRSIQISIPALCGSCRITATTPVGRAIEIVQVRVGLRVKGRWCHTHDKQEHASEPNR